MLCAIALPVSLQIASKKIVIYWANDEFNVSL
jgi:hypothetical protein